jgi:hypothetical protein
LQQAQHLAVRVEREAGADKAAQIKLLYRIAFSREPVEKELKRSLEFLKNEAARASGDRPAKDFALSPLGELAHVLLNSNEFVYIN